MDKYLTIEAVAEQLSVSQRTVYNLVSSGALPSYKFGRARRINERDLAAYASGAKERPQRVGRVRYPKLDYVPGMKVV